MYIQTKLRRHSAAAKRICEEKFDAARISARFLDQDPVFVFRLFRRRSKRPAMSSHQQQKEHCWYCQPAKHITSIREQHRFQAIIFY
jgi:hypothetical protein